MFRDFSWILKVLSLRETNKHFKKSVFIMVVKIAFWLVKSYDFTSQNMHYGLNRLKKSKMDKIGLKSGKIAKIGWNRVKSRFEDRFCDFKRKKGHPWSGLGMGTFSLQKRGALCPLCCLLPAMGILQVFLLLFLFLKLSFHLGRGKTLLDKWQKCTGGAMETTKHTSPLVLLKHL